MCLTRPIAMCYIGGTIKEGKKVSHEINTQLLARAHEAIEYALNDPSGIDVRMTRAIEDGDLEQLERLVSEVEAKMSQDFYFENAILERGDEY